MCTSIAAGKDTTLDGEVLIARNEDCLRANWNKYMVYREVPEYKKNRNTVRNNLWVLANGLEVPVPTNEFSYSGMPDAISSQEASAAVGDNFFYEERGINEKNFAISATNSLYANDRATKADSFVPAGGVAESIIPTLLLPQAESARHAVDLLGDYVEKYGAYEANGIHLADPYESWYFEIGSGHHWIAVRVPADAYVVVANGMRVHSVNLDASDDVRCSNGLFDFVVDSQLLDEPDKNNFNFAEAFGIPGKEYNEDRIWLAQKLLSSSCAQAPRQRQYPLFMKPDSKIAASDVMDMLRATYDGTELEEIAERPIGYEKTGESHIILLNQRLPHPLVGLIWQSVSTPLCAPYLPLHRAMHALPPGYSEGGNNYSSASAYWAFRGLYALAKSQEGDLLREVQQTWREYEQAFVAEHSYFEQMLLDLFEINPRLAVDSAARYSTGIAYEAIGKANRLRDQLMTKITEQ